MLDQEEFRRWRAEAQNALETANLSRSGDRHNWSCFLAEQAAQLAVKGLLHGLGAGHVGHDLVRLGAALSVAVDRPLTPDLREAFARLGQLYIPTRYPDTQPSGFPGERYTGGQADQALSDAAVVIAAVDEIWEQLERRSRS